MHLPHRPFLFQEMSGTNMPAQAMLDTLLGSEGGCALYIVGVIAEPRILDSIKLAGFIKGRHWL